MALTTEDSSIIQKTRELCESILEHPDFKSVRQNIDAFIADEKARQAYQELVERSEELNHKQHQGVTLSDAEVNDFKTQREKVVNNPLAANFIRAQQEMHGIQESINKYLSKTMELGRVPNESDMDDGRCGHGCGCDHNH